MRRIQWGFRGTIHSKTPVGGYVGSYAESYIEQTGDDPEHEALLAESVGLALLVVMDAMSPDERVAFVFNDVFGVPFAEIAAILECTSTAARQLASRARRRVRGSTALSRSDVARQQQLVGAFLDASRTGNFARLLELLHPDVPLRDEREQVLERAREVRGSRAVAQRIMLGRARGAQTALVNGSVGVVVAPFGRLQFAVAVTISENRISAVDLLADPARLSHPRSADRPGHATPARRPRRAEFVVRSTLALPVSQSVPPSG